MQPSVDHRPMRLLMVEDSEEDARLLFSELTQANNRISFQRVDCAEDMRAALSDADWDIVISDHYMPRFSSLEALALLKEFGKDIPFIIYSGNVSEHVEVAALYSGAQDSIQKGNIARLLPAIERELNGAEIRRAKEQADARVHKLAFYDSLTGLPNRNLFCDYVSDKLAQPDVHSATVFVLDIDRLLRINNCFGYKIADTLIGLVGQRLQECVPDEGMVARLGSDEFAVFLGELGGVEGAREAAEKIKGAFSRPFKPADVDLFATVSIGIAVSPFDGKEMADLLNNAETAMYQAKKLGGGAYQFYTPAMRDVSDEQWVLEPALHGAVERGELELEYQPLVQISTGKLTGVEALVRWRHPTLGVLEPDRFIPLANESGMILGIGRWVLRQACRQARIWHEAGHPDLTIAVNVSPVQFWEPGLVQFVAEVLAESALDPRCLELEITESVLMQDAEATSATLRALKAMNVKISVDDFGTGYSSLSYLKRFPIDILKIDRVFSSDVSRNNESAAIVQAISALARNLSLATVAEGVETVEQLDFFRRQHCERVQGFLFSRPRSASDITAMLETG